MADEIGRLTLVIEASLKEFNAHLNGAKNSIKNFSDDTKKNFKSVESNVESLSFGFGKVGSSIKGLISAFAGFWVFTRGIDLFKKFAAAAQEAVLANVSLQTAAGNSARALIAQADILKDKWHIDDEEIKHAQALAVGLLKDEQATLRLMPAIINLSKVKQINLATAADIVARAVKGDTEEIGRFGIGLDKASGIIARTEAAIKNINKAYGDQAEQLAKADDGTQRLKVAWSEFFETVGTGLKPVASGISNFLASIIEKFNKVAETAPLTTKELKTFIDNVERNPKAFPELQKDLPRLRQQLEDMNNDVLKGMSLFRGETLTKKQLEDLKKKQDEAAKAEAEAFKKRVETQSAGVSSALETYKKNIEFVLASADAAYKNHDITIEQSFNIRERMVREVAAKEEQALKTQITLTKELAEQVRLKAKIDQLRIDTNIQLIRLEEQRTEALKDQMAEQIKINDLKIQVEETNVIPEFDTISQLKSRQDKELIEKRKQLRELELLMKKSGVSEVQIAQDTALSKRAIAQLELKHEYDLAQAKRDMELDFKLQTVRSIGNLANDLYDLTGKKSIEMFNLGKAASAAEAAINVYQAITKALAQGGLWGWGAAIALGVSGMVQVAKILATPPPSMGAGGPIGGRSHATGGTQITAEKGEFIHPKKSVDYYGGGVMEGMRRRIIPKSLFESMNFKPVFAGSFAAAGGMVNQSTRQNTTIANFVDPNLFNQYLATRAGQKAVINTIAKNSFEIRKVIG